MSVRDSGSDVPKPQLNAIESVPTVQLGHEGQIDRPVSGQSPRRQGTHPEADGFERQRPPLSDDQLEMTIAHGSGVQDRDVTNGKDRLRVPGAEGMEQIQFPNNAWINVHQLNLRI